MLSRLSLVSILLLLTSCTADRASTQGPTESRGAAPSEPREWVEIPPVTVLSPGVGKQLAGWREGFLVASHTDAPGQFEVFTTKNGREWRAPVRGTELEAPSCCGRNVAGYGPAGYALGRNARGELTVRRTEDGENWESIELQLDGVGSNDPSDFHATIAAGAKGVIVVGSNSTYPPAFDGFYVWYSRDGRAFGPAVPVPAPTGDNILGGTAAATPTGFLMSTSADGTTILRSEDGKHWRDISANLPRDVIVEHLAENEGTTVAFAQQPARTRQPAWYRRDGVWRPAEVDPGRLPDVGVVPARQRRVNAVHTWGSGFLAAGNTYAEEGQPKTGLVWFSPDGASWIRMPVRHNGFDQASELMDVATGGQETMIIGYPSDDSERPLLRQIQATA